VIGARIQQGDGDDLARRLASSPRSHRRPLPSRVDKLEWAGLFTEPTPEEAAGTAEAIESAPTTGSSKCVGARQSTPYSRVELGPAARPRGVVAKVVLPLARAEDERVSPTIASPNGSRDRGRYARSWQRRSRLPRTIPESRSPRNAVRLNCRKSGQLRPRAWSVYGAEQAQPLANTGKSPRRQEPGNKPSPLP
jgi:hypothetical protein